MIEGFVVDNTDRGRQVSSWVEGEPRKSFWTGLKFDKEPIPVRTWRCNRCGFLENYAAA